MGKTYKKRNLRKKTNKRRTRKQRRVIKRRQKGGFVSPFQGTSYSQDNLPGMSINHNGGTNGNFYALNNYKETPFQYMKSGNSIMGGGGRRRKSKQRRKRGKKSKKRQKGGFLSDAVNLVRYGNYDVGSTWNQLQGYDKPVNPLPWDDQYQGTLNKNFTSIN
uniref:Uncharacterized protein n=1 Tax=viral metagenome TaxID=1070528 RepID=A0A6C0AXH7_9ZZZZ|tara:strand:- start:4319 stop:4804 length:486 start_codon:yes stop_codon:yes gene_type:complete